MILLTPKAATQVRTLRDGSEKPSGKLRLFVEHGGCSGMQYGMSFDDTKADDASFESEGVAIVVDLKSLEHLDGTTVDFDDGLHGKGFEIRNPNAHTTCGCGKSFN
jgi:iron-sulfur cluster assembly protein/iron-sulfur cluster insertion protein